MQITSSHVRDDPYPCQSQHSRLLMLQGCICRPAPSLGDIRSACGARIWQEKHLHRRRMQKCIAHYDKLAVHVVSKRSPGLMDISGLVLDCPLCRNGQWTPMSSGPYLDTIWTCTGQLLDRDWTDPGQISGHVLDRILDMPGLNSGHAWTGPWTLKWT
jgi:hypothetical protein